MPNQPKTQHRSVRVPDDLWRRAQACAKDNGETVADVIRRALEAYTVGSR
jgi:predicted DNA-binding protein